MTKDSNKLLKKIIDNFAIYSIIGGGLVTLIAIIITELTPDKYKILVENTIITIISVVITGCSIFLIVAILYSLRRKKL